MPKWCNCKFFGRKELIERHNTKLRFLLIGLLNTAFGLGAYPAIYYLTTPAKLHYLMVLVITQILCVTFSYLTNKFLVFRTSKNYLQEYGKFIAFHLSYFIVNLAVLPLLVEFAGMNPVWAQTLFAALVIVTSYFWHSRITFSQGKAAQ